MLTFIAQLVDGDEGVDGDEAGDDNMDVDEEPVRKYDRFSHVIKELDEIKLFLEVRGYSREADAVSSVVDMVASAHIASMKQTSHLLRTHKVISCSENTYYTKYCM